MKVILITGMPASGKSIVSEILKDKGIFVIKMGDVLREAALKENVDMKNLGKFSIEIREKYGKEIVAKLTYEKIKNLRISSDIIAIEGVRSLEEYMFFKDKFKDVILLAIHSSPKTRFKRIIERGREDDPKNFDEFIKRDLRELSYGIGNVIALADYMIINEGNIDNLKEEVENFLRNINFTSKNKNRF